MNENIKNLEQERNNGEFARDPRSEFRDLVDMGAYQSLSNNEFFQGLRSEEQFDVMQSTLENCLQSRERRFYRLVQGKPDLAAQYRDQEIKPLRTAMHALDEIALAKGKTEAMQEEIFHLEEEIDK
jgi:hypothetical protein